MASAQSTLAIVLRRVNHGEADRVVTLLTESHGRVSAYAKGVRKPKSKLAGGLELCMLSEISFIPSKRADGLATITSTRMKEYYETIVAKHELLQEVFLLIKMIDKASEYEEDTNSIFNLAVGVLRGFNDKNCDYRVSELWFLMHLSKTLGQGVELAKPLNSVIFSNDTRYHFDFDRMGFVEDSDGTLHPADIKLLKVMLLAQSPLKLRNIMNIEESIARLNPLLQHLKLQLGQL